jgi:stage III sporulation protein AH
MTKKKKIIILCAMAVLLVVTGYLNITLNNKVSTTSTTKVESSSFFQTYREDRTTTRNQEITYLDAIISSETSTAEAKSTAENKKVALVQSMEKELVIEGLIKSKGFDDVIVTSTTENVNVIVKSTDALTSNEVAQIVSIVKEQTKVSIENIKIIPIE